MFRVATALAHTSRSHQMGRFLNPLDLSHMSIWEKTCLKRTFVFEGHWEGVLEPPRKSCSFQLSYMSAVQE